MKDYGREFVNYLKAIFSGSAVGFSISGGTTPKTLTVDETVAISAKPTVADWVDYSATSTIVGWSSYTIKLIHYYIIGKLVMCVFNIEGTSDAVTASFTLPSTAAAFTGTIHFLGELSVAWDNGAYFASGGRVIVVDNTNLVICALDPNGQTAWTASGTKQVAGSICFITS